MPNSTLTTATRGGRPAARRSSLLTLALALAGPLAGCTVIVSDHGGHGPARDEDPWEACYDTYDDCLDDADGDKEAVLACGDALEACVGEADGGSGGSGGSGDAGDSGGAGDSGDAGDAGDAGDSGDSGDAGDGPAIEICVSLHQTCVASAGSLEETLACEALYEHCVDPGVCAADPCPKACAGLDLCLADYGQCVAAATKDYQVDACNLVFDGCVVDEGGDACLPDDDAQVDECLAEHALCTACAGTDEELAACKDVFDACVHPPV